jgi:hypothetical protein
MGLNVYVLYIHTYLIVNCVATVHCSHVLYSRLQISRYSLQLFRVIFRKLISFIVSICGCVHTHTHTHIYIYIQGVPARM